MMFYFARCIQAADLFGIKRVAVGCDGGDGGGALVAWWTCWGGRLYVHIVKLPNVSYCRWYSACITLQMRVRTSRDRRYLGTSSAGSGRTHHVHQRPKIQERLCSSCLHRKSSTHRENPTKQLEKPYQIIGTYLDIRVTSYSKCWVAVVCWLAEKVYYAGFSDTCNEWHSYGIRGGVRVKSKKSYYSTLHKPESPRTRTRM